MQVGKLTTAPIRINVPAEFKKLVPQRQRVRASLRIDNVHGTIVSALRRTIQCEMPIVGFMCTVADCESDDAHVFQTVEIVCERIGMMSVDQNAPLDASWRIDVRAQDTPLDVTMGMATQVGGKRIGAIPCEHGVVLCTLQPRKYLRVNFRMSKSAPMVRGEGGRAIAAGVAAVALDLDATVHATTHSYRSWELRFDTNGTASARDIVTHACLNIEARLRTADSIAREQVTTSADNYHECTLHDTVTIGEMLCAHIHDQQTNIDAVALAHGPDAITLRMRTENDPHETICGVIAYLISAFEEIRRAL